VSERKTFSLCRKEEVIDLEDRNGNKGTFFVRELSGADRDKFLNVLGKKIKMVDGKPAGLTDYNGSCSDLLSLCVFDEQNQLVKVELIQSWPSSTQQAILEIATKLSGMNKEAEAEAKNG
jgi:hypothetical protein